MQIFINFQLFIGTLQTWKPAPKLNCLLMMKNVFFIRPIHCVLISYFSQGILCHLPALAVTGPLINLFHQQNCQFVLQYA